MQKENPLTLLEKKYEIEEIKDLVDTAIREQISHRDVGQVGVRFLRFCGRYDLVKMSESAETTAQWLNQTYQGELNDA